MKNLTTSLISSASSSFFAVQFPKFQRPFWDKSLRAAHSKSKQAYVFGVVLVGPQLAMTLLDWHAHTSVWNVFFAGDFVGSSRRKPTGSFVRSIYDRKLFHHIRMRNGGSSSTLTSSICFNNCVFDGAAI